MSASRYISPARTHYALAILSLTYVFNFLDRQLLGILVEPIKAEFQVSDTQMGILYGFAFSIFYIGLSIPIAIWADRSSRRNILALAAMSWSVMSMLCGVAANYWQLLLFRIGVGIGEAGGTPPSQSLINDYYPPQHRSMAMAIFSCGTFVGTLLAFVGGAWITENYGWRITFILVGAPGILLAVLIRLTLPEPVRGRWDSKPPAKEKPNPLAAFQSMWGTPALRYLLLGAACASLGGYGLGYWQVSFLIRVHELSLLEAGIAAGVFGASSALLGSLVGGYLCDRMAQRNRAWQMRLPALSLLVSLPFLLLFLLWPAGHDLYFQGFRLPVAVLFFVLSGLVGAWWAPASYVAVQALVAPGNRTLASAILMMFMTLVGLSIGPVLVGWITDLMRPTFGVQSIRWGLSAGFLAYILAVYFYWRGSRHYAADCFEQHNAPDDIPDSTPDSTPDSIPAD